MQPTQQDLEAGVKAVEYELSALISAMRANHLALRQLKAATSNSAQQIWQTFDNCTQEAFLIHYRNLKQFLNNQKGGNDVKAKHYADNWSGSANVVGESSEDTRLNRLLAHISYDRAKLTRDWNYPNLEQLVCNAFDNFVNRVRPQHKPLFDGCRQALLSRKAGAPLGPVSNGTATVTVFSVAGFDSCFTHEMGPRPERQV